MGENSNLSKTGFEVDAYGGPVPTFRFINPHADLLHVPRIGSV